jgi:hypothetical protein
LVLSAAGAAAQTPAPKPVPAIPPTVQTPAAPVIVAPFELHPPFEFHFPELQMDLHREALEKSRRAVEEAREEVEKFREFRLIDENHLRFEVEKARDAVWAVAEEMKWADVQGAVPAVPMGPRGEGPFAIRRGGSDSTTYSRGLQAIAGHQYDRAVTLFDQVIAMKDTRVDAALYWKAFAQFKAAKPSEAQASIAQLRRDHPQSRYLSEVKMLEADMRRQSGQPVSVEDQAVNDDIKILAIQSMQRTDPERALPLLEGVLTAANSLEVKKRALYVLALSDDARARQILLRYAKGAGSPDLQPTAVGYVASRRDRATTAADLREIYDSTQDAGVRRAVIEAYRATGDKSSLITVAANPGNPVLLRSTAVNGLSNLAGPQELWALYQKEGDVSLRTTMTNVFGSMGAVEQLTEIARTDKEIAVRQRAIQLLGSQRPERTGQVLSDMYGANQDRAVRSSIIRALASQNNAAGLVAIARKETNLDLKKQIVSQLSGMSAKSPAAADYLMEMLKQQ